MSRRQRLSQVHCSLGWAVLAASNPVALFPQIPSGAVGGALAGSPGGLGRGQSGRPVIHQCPQSETWHTLGHFQSPLNPSTRGLVSHLLARRPYLVSSTPSAVRWAEFMGHRGPPLCQAPHESGLSQGPVASSHCLSTASVAP